MSSSLLGYVAWAIGQWIRTESIDFLGVVEVHLWNLVQLRAITNYLSFCLFLWFVVHSIKCMYCRGFSQLYVCYLSYMFKVVHCSLYHSHKCYQDLIARDVGVSHWLAFFMGFVPIIDFCDSQICDLSICSQFLLELSLEYFFPSFSGVLLEYALMFAHVTSCLFSRSARKHPFHTQA